MYKLLRDKNNEFQCEIRLEGTSAKNASVRLFLEGDGCEYSFIGKIDGEKCTVPIGKMKRFPNLLENGIIRLEVIAEDTWFVPYKSEYQLDQEKRVTVEVKQDIPKETKPMVEVKVADQEKPKDKDFEPIRKIIFYLVENGNFDGSRKSFMNITKDIKHRVFFNSVCEFYNLDKSTVLKKILN